MGSAGGVACEWSDCSRDFESVHSMKIHHVKSHGESIAGVDVECATCGSEKHVSTDHHRRVERHFCDSECQAEWRAENLIGENNPKYECITVQCGWCGSELVREPNHIARNKQMFCDHECYGSWRAESRSGEDHPLWKGGHERWYGSNWKKQRERRLKLDGRSCQSCDSESNLAVHHHIPVRVYRDDSSSHVEDANHLWNLVTLCKRCHDALEGRRKSSGVAFG